MEAIKTRRSIRNYSGEALSEEHKSIVLQYINDEKNLVGLFGNPIRIVYKEVAEVSKKEKIGTYGFIKSAPAYLICICKNNEESMLDVGYVFENFILFLHEIGIGTCWIGGTFHRKKLEIEQSISNEVFIPIISPFGYEEDKLHFFEKLIRKVAKSDFRKDFDHLFFRNDFKSKISDPSVRELLEYVRLAPSASNKQPWRLVVCKNELVHFFIERTTKYGQTLSYDIQMVDIGIALSHYLKVSGKKNVYRKEPGIKLPNENYSYVLTVN